MSKRVWITALAKDEAKIAGLMGSLKKYGLATDGHFWVDDIKNMAWQAAAEELLKADTALWIVAGNTEDLKKTSLAYGLSLLAMKVYASKGESFPVIFAPAADLPAGFEMPTLLKGAEVIPSSSASLGVKAVSFANTPLKKIEKEYRLNVHGLPGIGLWLEAGPSSVEWQGAMFGVHGAEIDFHGVGPSNGVPERAVLEYAQKGLKIQLGEDEFTAWAIQNKLEPGMSYYVRVQGMPDRLLFGPYAQTEEAEVHVVKLY
jgi:hypothetical protein